MRGKRWIAGLMLMMLSLTSGCRLCERWYEREHDPYDRERPRYWQQPNCCPQGCVPQQQCPQGCAPAYGAGYSQPGYTPSYAPGCGCP